MKYWTILNGNPVGPMDLEQLIATPGFGPDTPVWHEGMDDWSTAGKLPQLAPLWQNQQQQPPKAEPYYGSDPYNRPNPFRQAPYGQNYGQNGGAQNGAYGQNGSYGQNEREPYHTYAPGS
ncbi:MAG: DUF4339 domain-containing protein, partial [Duncaniella sp.]|nr:DUF4339 domain-containing protein [Duncaniella sp.]